MILKQPALIHACDISVNLDPIMELGSGRAGQRRIIPIAGGTITGEKINGSLLNLGADWQTVFDNGLTELDTRYAMKTDDDAIIEIINFGYRHGPAEVLAAIARGEDVSPDSYYMRTHARLETGDKRYEWVNKTLFIGTGARFKQAVVLSLFQIS